MTRPKKPRRKLPIVDPDAHLADLAVNCPARGCGAVVGVECVGTAPEIVHFGRRLKRLLAGYRTNGEAGSVERRFGARA